MFKNYLTYVMMAFAMLSFVSIALGNVLLGLATALFLVYVYKNGIKIEEEHNGYFMLTASLCSPYCYPLYLVVT